MQGGGRRWFSRAAAGGLLLAGLSGVPATLSAGPANATSAAAQVGAAQNGAAQNGAAQNGATQNGAAQVGPAQINAMGRPDLCWQAGGNGAMVALARCDSALQAQQWALTGNGVLMNGTGYCLEAAAGGLFIDFADQCGGSPSQRWQFRAATGTLTSAGTGRCAVAAGALTPGTAVAGGFCTAAAAADRRWSLGYSAVTVSGVPAGSLAARGLTGGTFTAAAAVVNGASAQAAYGATVRLGVPRGVTVRALRGTGGAAGWRCNVPALTCSGNLAAGDTGRIEIAGRLPAAARPGTGYRLLAAVSVAGTSQQTGTVPLTAPVPVTVAAGAPPGPGGAAASAAGGSSGQNGAGQKGAGQGSAAGSGTAGRSVLVAGLLLLGGGLLIAVTRRRPAGGPPGAPGARASDGATATPPSGRATADAERRATADAGPRATAPHAERRATADAQLTDTQPFVWID